MRLAFVTPEYPPFSAAVAGGIGAWATSLAPAMAARGHDVQVFTWASASAGTLEHAGVTVHVMEMPRARKVPGARTLMNGFAPARRVLAELRLQQPLHLVIAPEWRGDAWLYAATRRRSPLVTQLAGSGRLIAQYKDERPGLRGATVHRFEDARERFQTTHSDAVLASSQAVLRQTDALWSLGAIPTFVLPHAVDVRRIARLAASGRAAFAPAPGSVVFLGRLEHYKGIHVAAEAMRRVWATRPDAELVLAGSDHPWADGTLTASEHVKAVAGPFAERVRALGSLPHCKLFPIIARADVVVTPSLYETFGLAALEAMSLGVPVVATRDTGFSQFLRDGQDGLLVPPGEPVSLADAIARLLADAELRARLGRSAATRAGAFDVGAIAARHEELFCQLVV